jgi:cyclomaltodextrinase / maltogenic alpha-amylase / neopullulanase
MEASRPWPADWVRRAIIYGVVPQAWGGGAGAVRRRLDYLEGLGVTVLWLWPPVETRLWGQTYAITDYRALDKTWGRPATLKRLIAEAQSRGMHVLADFVPNHTSLWHPWYVRAQRLGPADPAWDYYDRDETGQATHYFHYTHLPNLNLGNPAVREEILQAMLHWVNDYGFDGFRQDMAWAPPLRTPDFWSWCNAELRKANPDLLMLAEAPPLGPDGQPGAVGWYQRNGFDITYDWGDDLGHPTWETAWEHPRTADLLADALRRTTPEHGLVLRFLDNNDTGTRFVDRVGVERARVAAVLMMTVPGVPALWAGQEIGASYLPYELRESLPWTDRGGLLELHRRLIALRGLEPALLGDGMQIVAASGQLLAYRRSDPAARSVLVVLNFGPAAPLTLDEAERDALGEQPRDLLTDQPVDLTEQMTVPATSSLVLAGA